MKAILASALILASSGPALARQPKATLCATKATQMAVAYFGVNYDDARILTVEPELVSMNHGYGEGDEGLGSETWNIRVKAYFDRHGSTLDMAPIEVQMRIDGNSCMAVNVSMPTAG